MGYLRIHKLTVGNPFILRNFEVVIFDTFFQISNLVCFCPIKVKCFKQNPSLLNFLLNVYQKEKIIASRFVQKIFRISQFLLSVKLWEDAIGKVLYREIFLKAKISRTFGFSSF